MRSFNSYKYVIYEKTVVGKATRAWLFQQQLAAWEKSEIKSRKKKDGGVYASRTSHLSMLRVVAEKLIPTLRTLRGSEAKGAV